MDSGAHFHRIDLQVHSPRDPKWIGPKPKSEADWKDFAHELLLICRKIGLNGIAITDHHDVEFVRFLRPIAEEWNANSDFKIAIWPGMELTLSLPCQALLILDSNIEDEALSALYPSLSLAEPPGLEFGPAPIEAIKCDRLSQLYQSLDERKLLKGRYIILPNVSDSGHKTLLRKGFHHKYAEMPCPGAYVDGPAEKLGTGNRTILAGQSVDYGNKKVAVIQTSDCRRLSDTALGNPSSWIKWSEPTAEALRQACLAEESRIALSDPELPRLWISSVAVTSSKFLGAMQVEMNPQFNAIIGGRGSGKSTLLEYTRWCLCDEWPSAKDNEAGDYAVRAARLVEATLQPLAGVIVVGLEIDGVPHYVRRHSQTGEVSLRIADGEYQSCSEQDIRELFPLLSFSQKQLSSISIKPSELNRFLEAPILDQLRDLSTKLEENGEALAGAQARLSQQRRLTAEQSQLRTREISISSRLTQVRKSMKGVSEAEAKLLALSTAYDGESAWLEAIRSELSDQVEALKEVVSSLDSWPDQSEFQVEGTPHQKEIELLITKTTEALVNVKKLAKQAGSAVWNITKQTSDFSKVVREIEADIKAKQKEIVTIRQRSVENKAVANQIKSLEDELSKTKTRLQQIAGLLKPLADANAERDQRLTERFKALFERKALLGNQGMRLSDDSKGFIRVRVGDAPNLRQFHEKFQQSLAGSNIRTAKVSSMIELLENDKAPLTLLEALLRELDYLSACAANQIPVDRKKTPFIAKTFTPEEVERIGAKITSDQWVTLTLTEVPTTAEFSYRVGTDEYIGFADASAGQQASALLRALLAWTGPPLLIDQPEDDLDSSMVSELVSDIWSAKRRRQFIFASHNANLVVNGDAELVVCFDYKTIGDRVTGVVAAEGAIDIADVRRSITRVMEGGERAFRLRMEKYGF